MSDLHLLASLGQAVLFLAIGLTIGDRVILRSSTSGERAAPVERALMALVGAVAFAVLAMLAHVASGGRVFSHPLAVPLLGLGFLVWGRRSFRDLRIPRARLYALAGFAALLALIYLVPVLRGDTSVRIGDPPWHLGWTEQLLDGEPLPTGAAPPPLARNAYPWGFHAVLASLVRLVPGTSPLIALDAVFMTLLAGIPLAAAAIARRIDPRAGWGAALAVAFVGGWGWAWARMPEFATSPRSARFGADLVVASPNSVYELFPPGLPRELGLVLLGGAALTIALARSGGRGAWMRAGGAVGLVGLVSVPMFVPALVWLLVGASLEPAARRGRALAWSLGTALVCFGFWAAPVAARYAMEGGFVNITPQLGREWPLPVALGSWGLLVVGAAWGIVVALRRREPQARTILAAAAATGLLLALALARGAFDWGLAGNATLLHQGRIWPPAHLLAAAFAGVALAHLYTRAGPRRPRYVIASVGLAALGLASPVLASIELGTIMSRGEEGFIYAREDIVSPDSFVQAAAARLPADAVVEVRGPDELAFLLFQFSGARPAGFDDPRLGGNDLRIRYRDLASDWDRRIAGGGFEPNYIVEPIEARSTVVTGLVSGRFAGTTYVLYASG